MFALTNADSRMEDDLAGFLQTREDALDRARLVEAQMLKRGFGSCMDQLELIVSRHRTRSGWGRGHKAMKKEDINGN